MKRVLQCVNFLLFLKNRSSMTSSDRCLQTNVSIVEDEKYMFNNVEKSEQRFIQMDER